MKLELSICRYFTWSTKFELKSELFRILSVY